MRTAPRLRTWLHPYRGRLAAALGLGLLAAVAEGFTYSLLIPFLRLLFGGDGAFPGTPTAVEAALRALIGGLLGDATGVAAVAVVLGCIAGALLVKNASLYASAYAGLAAQEGVVHDLRVAAYGHLQRLGLPFFTTARAGDLAARVLSDADQARGAVQSVTTAARNAAAVIVYLVILFALSWRLALAAVAIVAAVTLAMRPVLKAVRRRWRVVTERRAMLGSVTVETAAAARAVKAAAAEAHEVARFRAAADDVRRGVLRAERVALLASPLTETVAAAAMLLVLLLAGAGGGLRPEVFVAFVAVALRMLSPVKAVAHVPALIAEASAASDRLFALLRLHPEAADPPTARTFTDVREAIEFRDVWVAYEPGAWVLRGVDLRLGRGEVVALVGPSGAGKSTLADLLPRFVEPDRGGVFADGVPLSAFSRRSLRAALGIVSQETVLLHESVRANIAYGDRWNASDAEVEAAARAANAHGFITRLPDGYGTVIGERGVRLSGGERQRLAIARALLRNPPVLVLDEATAHLDADAEAEVQEAVARLMAGRTVLLIAHRLSAAARADRIAVLEGGRIVEQGSHAALLARDGRYRRLVERQGAPLSGGLVGAVGFVGQVARDERWIEVEHGDR